MAFLPAGMAEATAREKAARGYDRATDGEYIYVIKDVSYEEVSTQKGTKEHALIIRQRVVESRPHPQGQPEGIKPNAVGTDIDYFLPDYGDAKVMLKKNLKGYVLGLLGLDEKAVDPGKLAETIGLIGGPRQLARGMLIRGVTFHTNKKEGGGDFMGFNWHPVAGENIPDAPSVIERRKAIEAEATSEVPIGNTNGAVASAPPSIPGAPPSVPGVPPSVPSNGNPMDGWSQHPSNTAYFYRADKGKKGAYTQAEILAGNFSREG